MPNTAQKIVPNNSQSDTKQIELTQLCPNLFPTPAFPPSFVLDTFILLHPRILSNPALSRHMRLTGTLTLIH
jgi:hypothetical protein